MQAQLRDPDWKHDVWVRLTTVRQSTIIMGHRINDDHEASCPMLNRTMKRTIQFQYLAFTCLDDEPKVVAS